jgi:hypothetical protein
MIIFFDFSNMPLIVLIFKIILKIYDILIIGSIFCSGL